MRKTREAEIKRLEKAVKKIRRDILEISYRANVGHIGSALCIADILTVLYKKILKINPKKPLDPSRDRFILSKGHAAAALYAMLHQKGFFSRKKLLTFCQDGGVFGVHPEYNPRLGIELSTGSLGHGLSVGTGLALGLRNLKKKGQGPPRVFVLVSDAELNEGSTWEAIMFAAQHKLDNLIVLVDDNHTQALGKTKDILDLQPLLDKWQVFGWEARVVNGHNIKELLAIFRHLPFIEKKPSVVIAKTVIGKGVSFMENNFAWHYLSLSTPLYKKALNEI